jgi:hypothetical protein
MGDLVMFRLRSNATPQTEAPRRSEGGEIVFFTGVRYERYEPASGIAALKTPPNGGLSGPGRGRRKKRA